MHITSKITTSILFAISLIPNAILAGKEIKITDYYSIEKIALPDGIPPEVGAVKFDTEGTLYVVLRRGDILMAKPNEDPDKFEWKLFASGFHNGCGMEVVAPGHILVSQMAELTEVKDTDGDGVADSYKNLADQWGVSGNYHETNEICPDGNGGYYIAIGTASHNGPTFYNVRGEYSEIGRRGRNYSAVKWKGWVLHYSKDGVVTPFASGFRMHNGITRDTKGNIWATDNQGDWKATTPLYHVEKGNFYGHPSSLVWDPKWPEGKDPLKMSLEEINGMRTRAAVLLPHAEFNRSASEAIEVSEKFGPFVGQLLIPDNNGTRMSRIMLDKVQGKYQGSCTHFINGSPLRSGGNRAVFTNDGKTLYIGHTVRGWGTPAEGLTRITYHGKVPFDVKHIRLNEHGFQLEFTLPIVKNSVRLEDFSVLSYRYEDKWLYGGDKLDKREEKVSSVRSVDADSIELNIEKLEAGRVYEIQIYQDSKLKCETGEPLLNKVFCYTLNQLVN
jgi:glucose/arabinose dehydrogenase